MTPTLEVRVARKVPEADGICSLELVDVRGSTLPAFTAGAHVEVHVPGGLVRHYSICNDPTENYRYLIAVLRDPATRGGSAAIHDEVQAGDTLAISAPRNHFKLASNAQRTLLLAGGIGITPLLAMAEKLARDRADFALHYAMRSPARTAFRERLAAASFSQCVHFHFDDGAPEQRMNLDALLTANIKSTHLYVCGPQGFIDAALRTARTQGWPEPLLHYEYFGAETAIRQTDGPFELMVASTGRVVTVARNQTAAQALNNAGVQVMTSCEQGVCGTCLTRVLDGRPDHRDSYLTPAEQAANDQFLPCCSRALSARLVLAL